MMNATQTGAALFPQLPDSAKVWIYTATRELSQPEVDEIISKGKAFASQWLSHGREVKGAVSLLYNRFLIIAASEEAFQVSGCSIDKTVAFVRELAEQFHIDFFDRFYTCAIIENEVVGFNKEMFREAYKNGTITKDTLVYNSLTADLQSLRNNWLIPVSKSWHAKVFSVIG